MAEHRHQQRGYTEAEWLGEQGDPILLERETVLFTDTGEYAIGNGNDTVSVLTRYGGGLNVVIVAGTSETVDGSDHNTYRRYTNASEVTVSLAAGVDEGVLVHGRVVGAGGVVVQDDGTSTVNGAGSVGQGDEFSAISLGGNEWDVEGAL